MAHINKNTEANNIVETMIFGDASFAFILADHPVFVIIRLFVNVILRENRQIVIKVNVYVRDELVNSDGCVFCEYYFHGGKISHFPYTSSEFERSYKRKTTE